LNTVFSKNRYYRQPSTQRYSTLQDNEFKISPKVFDANTLIDFSAKKAHLE
jgi:hypothetical protein